MCVCIYYGYKIEYPIQIDLLFIHSIYDDTMNNDIWTYKSFNPFII